LLISFSKFAISARLFSNPAQFALHARHEVDLAQNMSASANTQACSIECAAQIRLNPLD
jgi:hypothetical protein